MSKNSDCDYSVVLFRPEIPGNTGSIGRTCVALNLRLIIIHPCAFDLSEKAVRRAGLDYWKHVQLTNYDSWEEFLEKEKPNLDPNNENLFFLSSKPKQTYFEADFKKGAYLIFGQETKGLPSFIHEEYKERLFTIPMHSEHVRSLNLSNAATAVIYECYRQISLPKVPGAFVHH